MRLPNALGALREPNVARYLAATAVSTLGSGIAMVALAFAVLDVGGATDLGIVLLAREIPIVVFLLLGGVFADRLSRRAILVGSDLVKGAAQAATAALFFTGTADVWKVALLQMVFGVAVSFSRPASFGIIKQAASNERLQQANALLQLARSSLSIAGPAIGALIVAAGSPALALAIDASTFVASALLIASMRLALAVRPPAASILADLREGWHEFIDRTWVVAMVASFGLFQLTYFPALLVLGPLVAKQDLGGVGAWGLILAIGSAGAVAGGVLALHLTAHRPLVATTLLAIPAGMFLATLSIPLLLALICLMSFAAGVGFSIGETLWFTTLQRNVPEHVLSRISSFDWLGSVALNPIGYLVVGPLSGAIGTSETLALAAVLNVGVSLSLLLVPSVRGLKTAPVS